MSPPLLTLEPLLESVREGVDAAGWSLSGLQKTTSHEFEGRWAGDSTRSAYLFFHRDAVDHASVEAYLDETSRGLRGNLSLVIDLGTPGTLPAPYAVLDILSRVADHHLPEGYRVPVSLRMRRSDARVTDEPELEARLKLPVPGAALHAGAGAVAALASAAVRAFDAVLDDPALRDLTR